MKLTAELIASLLNPRVDPKEKVFWLDNKGCSIFQMIGPDGEKTKALASFLVNTEKGVGTEDAPIYPAPGSTTFFPSGMVVTALDWNAVGIYADDLLKEERPGIAEAVHEALADTFLAQRKAIAERV